MDAARRTIQDSAPPPAASQGVGEIGAAVTAEAVGGEEKDGCRRVIAVGKRRDVVRSSTALCGWG